MNICYLGLGSNLNTPHRHIIQAIAAIKKLPQTYMIGHSPFIQTEPLSSVHQPKYCNTVVAIRTRLQPLDLLSYCQHIENSQQRVRKTHWGSRTIDIDLLSYNDILMNHPRLTLPHPGMAVRSFVQEGLKTIRQLNNSPRG